MSRKSHVARTQQRTVPEPQSTPAPRRFRPEWVAAALVLIASAWMVTEGDWNFLGTTGRLEGFYEAQAESLLHGHIDVPDNAILDEAFIRNGKNYGYFGPTPALFRIPLVVLFPDMNGKWSRWSMLVGTAVMLAALLLLIVRLEDLVPPLAQARSWPWLRTGLVLAAGIGSTQFFICGESKVYQESIEWAASLSLLSLVCLVTFLMKRRMPWLWAACGGAFLSFFARVSSGAGPIFALFLVGVALLLPDSRLRTWLGIGELPERRRALAALAATVALTSALWMGLNYWKFGMFFTSQPMYMQKQYSPSRLAHIKGDLASLTNIPLTVSTYLSPKNFRFMPGFPYMETTLISSQELWRRFPAAHFDYCEWFAAVEDAMPALFFGALGGTILCLGAGGKLRQFRAPLLGAIAGSGLVFVWGLIAYRYLHDLFPWHVLGAAIALTWIATRESAGVRRGLTAAFLVATVWSMWANTAFGLIHQRVHTFPIAPEKRIAFLDLSGYTAQGGLGSVIPYMRQWREYMPAWKTSSEQNLVLRRDPGRLDSFIVDSGPTPPFQAGYQFTVPSDGEYELSLRYSSSQPRPLLLSLNGTPVGYVCTAATGGDGPSYQKWIFGGKHRLPRGPLYLALGSNQPFPTLTFLRLTKVS